MTVVTSPEPRTEPAAPRAGQRISARYWVCLGLLVCSAAGLRAAAWQLGLFLQKEAVPLKKPLALFDTSKLGPRFELNRALTDAAPPLSEDLLAGLGTKEYAQLFLTDTEKGINDPTRVASVFITYYTGKPDLVPHVPDECWHAAGFNQVGAWMTDVRAADVGAPGDRVPLRVLEYEGGKKTAFTADAAERATVMYFFHANGGYTTTRDGVRGRLTNPFQRYAYYAKVEIVFRNSQGAYAGKDASIACAGPLIERLMPVLLTEHIDLDRFGDAATHRSADGNSRQ